MRWSLVALLAACAALPASADWQFTKWDMSRDEVIAAAQGTAKAVEGRPGQRVWEQDLGATGSISEGGIDLASEFFFNKQGRLKIVRLSPTSSARCGDLKTYAENTFGKPEDSASGTMYDRARYVTEYWRDVPKGNVMRFSDVEAGDMHICFVVYVPIGSADEHGVPHFEQSSLPHDRGQNE